MKKIYIFGHQNPDTDSVTSAITLSYLKNKLGFKTTPKILGDINNETKFVLNYFKIEKPKYLHDVKLQISDIHYQKNYFFHQKESIYKSFLYMNKNFIGTLPIIDDNKKFQGLVSMKDIAKSYINGDYRNMCTSYNNVLEVLEGQEVLKFDEEINGSILVAAFRTATFINSININNNSILITGDRHNIHKYAISNFAKLIIITKNGALKKENLELAKINKVNIIKTPFDTFQVAKVINLCNYISSIINNNNIIYFKENNYVENFRKIANKTKYSNYPILNNENQCLGILSLSDLEQKRKKKVILVDHNESSQSVIGLEEAEIIEIIDHHKIGNIDTQLPISFRNMPVGSTNTIIFNLFKENKIKIPKKMAGLMLAGIISDTLLLTSPTTTKKDKEALIILSKIAQINYEKFAVLMFKEGSSLKDKSKEEIIYSDFKNFSIKDYSVGIGQIITTDPNEIKDNINDYLNFIEDEAKNKKYDVFAIFITDVLKKGSYVLYSNNSKELISNAFKIKKIKQFYFINDCLSRKQQIIPKIIETIEKD